jgi:hypothetical protein
LLIVGGTASWLTWNVEWSAIAVTQPAIPSSIATTVPIVPAVPIADAGPAGPGRLGPPQPNPALEEWHRVKDINTVGLMSVAIGFVLTALGIVRIAFSRTERRHYREEDLT